MLIPSWDGFRIPVALAPINPKRKGHQNILFRQMLKDFEPPAWVREIIVVADPGYAANVTLTLINELHWTCVFAMPRTRKCTNGTYVRDMIQHLPKAAIVGPRLSLMGAAKIPGCFCVMPSCISWAMSRLYYPGLWRFLRPYAA